MLLVLIVFFGDLDVLCLMFWFWLSCVWCFLWMSRRRNILLMQTVVFCFGSNVSCVIHGLFWFWLCCVWCFLLMLGRRNVLLMQTVGKITSAVCNIANTV